MKSNADASPLAVLRIPDGRRLWAARVISDLGSGATAATLILSLSEWTASPRLVAVNGLLQAVPVILVAWFAGAFVDRRDRRRVMWVSDLIRAAVVASLVFAGPDRLWVIFVVTGVQAAVGAFFDPASSALLPQVVPAAIRPSAAGMFASSSMLASLVGVSLGGALVGLTPDRWVAFVFDASTFLAASLLVTRVRTGGTAASPGEESIAESDPRDFAPERGGLWRLIVGQPRVLAAVSGSMIAILGFGIVSVTIGPLLLLVLRADAAWFGPINGSFMVAAVGAGLLVGRLVRRTSVSTVFLTGLVLFGLGIAGMAIAPSVLILAVTQAACGLAQPLFSAGGTVILQSEVPDRFRGRAFAIVFTGYKVAEVVGIATVALAAGVLSLRWLLGLAAGIVMTAAVVCAYLLDRARERPATSRLSSER